MNFKDVFSILKNKYSGIWLIFHGSVFFLFLISLLFSSKTSFGTSLFEILPPSSSLHEVQKADSILSDKTGRAVTILSKASSFEKAKSEAEKLYGYYENKPEYFEKISLYVDSSDVSDFMQWLHENRFFLLSDDDIDLINSGEAAEIANDALSTVFGAFSFSDLSYLEEDPFLLSERNVKNYLEGGALSATSMVLKDDVLTLEKDGEWYVLIRGTVSREGSALASDKNTVKNLYKVTDELDGEFVFSGVPFHSYENSTSAQNQISIISTAALILIFYGFLWIFRSIIPAFLSSLAVSFSCLVGFVSVLLFFRGIHILTFVFGTTLIGTCLDYSIHFFVNWKGNLLCDSGVSVRNHILRGITLGFISTEICFLALFLSPFPLLKQVSVFLFFGLGSAYLSVIGIFPFLKLPEKRGINLKVKFFDNKFSFFRKSKKISVGILFLILVLSVSIIFIKRDSLKIKNNIQELYSISPEMLQNEINSAKILNTGSSGWYFILKADSEEKLLEKNEELADFLKTAVTENKLQNFLSVSQFIPSEKKQIESYLACENLLQLTKSQYSDLGFDDNSKFYEKSYRDCQNKFIHPGDISLPEMIKEVLSNLWIGEIDGNFYSCVLPLHCEKDQENFFSQYAENHEGIFFVNKVSDISSQLDNLSKIMLLMLAVAFVFIVLMLCFCYKLRNVLKIALIPIIVSLVVISVLLLCNISLSFFPITALILIFGLGLDYIIYAVEGKENSENGNLNKFAIFLSFVTTALSFGALMISNFPPVHMLGLTVFAGLLTAVTASFLLTEN